MIDEYSCCVDNCMRPVRFIRHTQFSGSHPFCEAHGLLERSVQPLNSEDSWEDLTKSPESLYGKVCAANTIEEISNLIFNSNVADQISLIRGGLPFSVAVVISRGLGAPLKQTANMIGLKSAWQLETKSRHQEIMTIDATDKLVSLLKIIRYYSTTFSQHGEDHHSIGKWLTHPLMALGNVPPSSLMDTFIGHDLVLSTLKRIEAGVFL